MSEKRYTVFAGEYPLGHRATMDEARELAAKNLEATRIVERLRAYPFTHLTEWGIEAWLDLLKH